MTYSHVSCNGPNQTTLIVQVKDLILYERFNVFFAETFFRHPESQIRTDVSFSWVVEVHNAMEDDFN